MSSATSTERERLGPVTPPDAGFKPWNFYVLIAMVAASVGVMMSKHTHPAALILLSLAIFATGIAGVAAHRAIAAFFSTGVEAETAAVHNLDILLRDKRRTLQSIKDIEFDLRMGKMSEKDFRSLAAPLRERALTLMQDIERASGGYRAQIERDVRERADTARAVEGIDEEAAQRTQFCSACGTASGLDARFCKRCGRSL